MCLKLNGSSVYAQFLLDLAFNSSACFSFPILSAMSKHCLLCFFCLVINILTLLFISQSTLTKD